MNRKNRYLALSLIISSIFLLLPFSTRNWAAQAETNPLKLNYLLSIKNPGEHFFEVKIRVSGNKSDSLDFAMPAWSPGRYVIFNFTRNVQEFAARAASGLLAVNKLDKQTWRVNCNGIDSFEVGYKVFANDLSGTFSQLDNTHANYNGASIYMYVVDHKQDAVDLKIEKPAQWRVINGVSEQPDQTEFHFNNYDLLIDTPTEVGEFALETFQLDQHTYRVMLHPLATLNDKTQLLEALKKIVAAETEIFGPPEPQSYTFLMHLVTASDHTDGMEHLNSTQIIEASVEDLIGTAAHEFFHLWNVKRLRPVELGPWDYNREVYTRSLWISEGLTSYYGDLSLARSGVWGRSRYYQALAEEVQTLDNRPGRKLMSLEQSSWDTWLYLAAPRTQLTNLDNIVVSYYNKGELIGLLLDFEIRKRTHNQKSLDDVFRAMYQEFYLNSQADSYYLKGRGFTQEDFFQMVNRVAGSDFSGFFHAYVTGTEEIDFNHFLDYAGLRLERTGGFCQIKEVLHASHEQLAFRDAWLKSTVANHKQAAKR